MNRVSALQNDRLLRALACQPVDVTPVWIMRQAGRYLPEYRAVREKAGSFLQLCKTPELASEVTLQPLARFDLDAAIIFSDILTIPDAMGLGLGFTEGEGPAFERPVRSMRDVKALGVPDPETDLRYVSDAIRLVRHELGGKVPLIGFCGSPFTLAAYMIEGRANKHFPHIQRMRGEAPDVLHALLDILTESVICHLNAQIQAGAQVVMIFDSWGGLLDTPGYEIFSLPYLSRIIQGLLRFHEGRAVPVILFTLHGGQWLEQMLTTGCDAIGIDWTLSLIEARLRVSGKVALQGNLDPAILKQDPDTIRREVSKVLAEYGEGPGHVFNLGHGITPDIPPEHVRVLVDAVHQGMIEQ